MITVRKAVMKDADRIYELNKHELGYNYPREKSIEKIYSILNHQDHCLLVACRDDTVIGYIHGANYELTCYDSLKNVMGIAVDSRWQSNGVGKSLLKALEKWANDDGASGIRLSSGIDREAAHKFYVNCGYTFSKQQKNFIKIF